MRARLIRAASVGFTAPRARGCHARRPVQPLPDPSWHFARLAACPVRRSSAPMPCGLDSRTGSVPLAALGLTTLWVTIFYGPTLMPNVLVALAAVVPRDVARCRAGAQAGLAMARGFGHCRGAGPPGDAAPIGGGLALVVLAHRPWRTRAVALLGPLVAGGGGVAGALPWIVESELRYGGTLARPPCPVPQGTGGVLCPTTNLCTGGPLLCRPCDRSANPIPPLASCCGGGVRCLQPAVLPSGAV